MLVTIDTDQLVRDAATMQMDNKYANHSEKSFIVWALQRQMPEGLNLSVRLREQVKEYKKLTMWRD